MAKAARSSRPASKSNKEHQRGTSQTYPSQVANLQLHRTNTHTMQSSLAVQSSNSQNQIASNNAHTARVIPRDINIQG